MIGQEIGNVGVVGAGVMGTGMMINTVMHGRKVVICDQSPEALASARDRLGAYLSRQIEKGRIESAFAQEARQRVPLLVAGLLRRAAMVAEVLPGAQVAMWMLLV